MRVILIIVGILALAMLVGCAGIMPVPGQPMPGMLFNSTTVPQALTLDTEYMVNPDSFEILGLTEGFSTNSNILGLFSTGNGGYIAALDDAISKAGADGLINCVVDVQQTSFLFLYSSSKTVVRGLAIKKK